MCGENMKIFREIYEMLVAATYAHAKWEYEVAQTILNDRKRLLILGLMLLPVLILPVVFATDLPPILGGKKAYAPAFSTASILAVSVIIGLTAGLITGCIGAGGGFVITPALMSAGIRGILAVGTDMFHIFAKAIMGTAIHKKLGNVSVKLAISFLAGSFIGVTCGAKINRMFYAMSPVMSDAFISIVYVLMLGILGVYAFRDYLRLRKMGVEVTAHDGGEEKKLPEGAVATTRIALKLQSMRIPPLIRFDEDVIPGGRTISAIFVSGCGFIVGFIAAIMGVGGGFLTFPMFVYILGVSSFTAVGTDIFQIIFTAGYASCVQYALYGFVFYTLAMGLLVGSLVGIQVGALTTKVVKGLHLRGFYAIAVLAGFLNRLFALPSKFLALGVIDMSKNLAEGLRMAGVVIFFALVGVFAAWVLMKFITNIRELREEV